MSLIGQSLLPTRSCGSACIHLLHFVLDQPGEEFEAENRLAFSVERLRSHPSRRGTPSLPHPDANVAHGLRDLIDACFPEKVTLREASNALHTHPVRMFNR